MTRRALLLYLLREAGSRGITTAELLQGGVGSRYGARLLELRAAGNVIEAERVRDGSWRYELTHDAERDTGHRPAGVSLGADPYPASQAGQPGGQSAPPHAPPRTAAPPTLFSLPDPDPEGEGPGFYDYDTAA